MSASVPRAALWVVCRRVRCGLGWLALVGGFVAEPVDELVTAWLGVSPVLPRLRRWRRHLVIEWRAYRAGAIEGELMEGVWR